MVWVKIFAVISELYKIIKYLIVRHKGQANFADIQLNYVSLETLTAPDKLEEIIIRNIKKINFNEAKKTFNFVSDLGSFTFNISEIQSITLFDINVYKDAAKT